MRQDATGRGAGDRGSASAYVSRTVSCDSRVFLTRVKGVQASGDSVPAAGGGDEPAAWAVVVRRVATPALAPATAAAGRDATRERRVRSMFFFKGE